jgi:hypothetical protein
LEGLLGDVVATFSAVGLPVAVFKGAALAHGYYAKPVQRAYGDVDLLIRAEDLDRADVALRDMGCIPGEPRWQQVLSDGYGEVFYVASRSATVDLHWHPTRELAVRRGFGLDTSDLIGRSQTVLIGDVAVPVLDTEDMLVVVCAHACFDGAYRLGWLMDAARIERSGRLRWDVLNDRCEETGLGLPVQVVLDRARHTLGYSPSIAPLSRGTWRKLTQALSALRPVEQTFGQVGRGGVVYRSTRRTTLRSSWTLGRLAITEVVKPVLTDPRHRWRQGREHRDRFNFSS